MSRSQLTTCPVIVQSTSGLVAARISNPAGMTSDPLALTAVLGPALTTVIVYTASAPAVSGSGSTLLLI